ncbi:MAG: hypothetical protein ACRYGR_08605 [Janthinobacterium lividum]
MTDTRPGAPLIISPEVVAALHRLRTVAGRAPVDAKLLLQLIETPRGKRLHLEQMQRQSVMIPGPWPFFVTFSIETNHPSGTVRHMSMSAQRDGRVPSPPAAWMVAELLGFTGGLGDCHAWTEKLTAGGVAVNLAQPVAASGPAGHA